MLRTPIRCLPDAGSPRIRGRFSRIGTCGAEARLYAVVRAGWVAALVEEAISAYVTMIVASIRSYKMGWNSLREPPDVRCRPKA